MENFVAELSQGRPDLLRNYAYNTLAPYLSLIPPIRSSAPNTPF